jgi:hypothetical protein
MTERRGLELIDVDVAAAGVSGALLSSLDDSIEELRSERSLLSNNAVTVAVKELDPVRNEKKV